MKNRIEIKLEDIKKKEKKALIPYITPEFPFKDSTIPILEALDSAGCDMIEIGIPFSDPLADGVTIQQSSFIALKNGVNLRKIFEIVRDFRKKSQTPIILMGYMNSIINSILGDGSGIDKFVNMAVDSGVDGLIVPDLPVEEADELIQVSEKYNLSNIFLIAPTSGDERIRLIFKMSTHLAYCVSLTGVTGVRDRIVDNSFVQFMSRVRRIADKPFVVGFGISRREHVLEIWRWADGVVVGSALLRKIAEGDSIEMCVRRAYEFILELNGHAQNKNMQIRCKWGGVSSQKK
jgi:tryptophan synthase alpha chain